MKKFILTSLMLLLLIVLCLIYAIFIWRGNHFNYINGTLGFEIKDHSIQANTFLHYPGYIYSGYDYELKDNTIIVWLYTKPRIDGQQESIQNFNIANINKGTYNIVYKNNNGIFINLKTIIIE